MLILPGNAVNRSAQLNRGLVSWWHHLPNRLGGGGSNWRDLMCRNHGTLIGGTAWRSPLGRPGGFGSLFFDGIDDYVNVNPCSGLSNSLVTIAFWARPTDTAANQYVGAGSDAATELNMRAVLLGFQDGFWNMFNNSAYPTGTPADTQIAATANVWQHVAFVSDGSTLQGYLNGVQQYSVSANLNASAFNRRLIGSAGASNWYTGNLDNWREYSRALSASEIAAVVLDDRAGNPMALNWLRRRQYAPEQTGGGVTAYSYWAWNQFSTPLEHGGH